MWNQEIELTREKMEKPDCYSLKIKSLDSDYADPREVLLHAAFQVLVNFVEEPMFKMIDWHWNDYNKNIYNESVALYNWWTVDRPNRHDPISDIAEEDVPDLPNLGNRKDPRFKKWNDACDKSDRLELLWNAEDAMMLQRLIAIREGMWT